MRQQRIYDFENDRTCADYIGELSEDAKSFYLRVVMRSAADPDQIAAGAGIGYFRLIWNIGQGFGRAIVGGASTLTEGIAQTFRDRISSTPKCERSSRTRTTSSFAIPKALCP